PRRFTVWPGSLLSKPPACPVSTRGTSVATRTSRNRSEIEGSPLGCGHGRIPLRVRARRRPPGRWRGPRPTHAFRGRRRGQELLPRSEEHTSELQSRENLVCRLLLEKKNKIHTPITVCRHT